MEERASRKAAAEAAVAKALDLRGLPGGSFGRTVLLCRLAVAHNDTGIESLMVTIALSSRSTAHWPCGRPRSSCLRPLVIALTPNAHSSLRPAPLCLQ